jgi:DNA-binding transcriptional ArsR family regulator
LKLVIALFYSVATHRGAHASAGERVLASSYLTQATSRPRLPEGSPVGFRGLLRDMPLDPSPELGRAADFFRLLGDQRRLRIVCLLFERERTAGELEKALGLLHLEMSYLWSSPDSVDGLRFGIVGQRFTSCAVSSDAPSAFEVGGRALAETGMAAMRLYQHSM